MAAIGTVTNTGNEPVNSDDIAAAIAAMSQAMDSPSHRVGIGQVNASRIAARKRNRSRDRSSNERPANIPNDMKAIALAETKRYRMVSADDAMSFAIFKMANSKVDTDRNRQYRRWMAGTVDGEVLACFRGIIRQYVSRENRRMNGHVSVDELTVTHGMDGDMTYRPNHATVDQYVNGIDTGEPVITTGETETVYRVASSGIVTIGKQFAPGLPPMRTVSIPDYRTIAAAYRADGPVMTTDRDGARVRVGTHDSVVHAMSQVAAGQSPDGRYRNTMARIREIGNPRTWTDDMGTFHVVDSSAPTVRLHREATLTALLSVNLYGVKGGEMERHSSLDPMDTLAMREWSERFMSADIPTGKCGDAIRSLLATVDHYRSMPGVTAGSSIAARFLPDDYLLRMIAERPRTVGEFVAVFVRFNTENRWDMDWPAMASLVFGENTNTNRKSLQRFTRAIASDTGGGLSTERTGMIGDTVMTYVRCLPVRWTDPNAMIPVIWQQLSEQWSVEHRPMPESGYIGRGYPIREPNGYRVLPTSAPVLHDPVTGHLVASVGVFPSDGSHY